MASGFESGITFNLTELGWADALAGVIDQTALRDAMLETLDEVEDIIIDHFEDKQASWDALNAATIQQRLRLGFGAGPILVRTGTLRDNVAANRDVEIDGTEISGAVFPAEVTPPKGKTPITEYAEALDKVRPFYDLSDDELEKVFDILEEKIAEKLGFI